MTSHSSSLASMRPHYQTIARPTDLNPKFREQRNDLEPYPDNSLHNIMDERILLCNVESTIEEQTDCII